LPAFAAETSTLYVVALAFLPVVDAGLATFAAGCRGETGRRRG